MLTSLCRGKWIDRDSLWIEIPIERHPSLGDKTIHSEILIAQKSDVKRIFHNMPHMEKILHPVDPSSLFWDSKDTHLVIYGENNESVEALGTDDRIMQSLKQYQNYLYAIHITDQRLYNKFDFVMKAQLRLDPRLVYGDKGEWRQLIRDLFYMADQLSKIKINHKVQLDTLKRR